MDLPVWKKKPRSYRSDKDYIENVSDESLYGILVAWENWNGPVSEF
jgi:hypothetical protein